VNSTELADVIKGGITESTDINIINNFFNTCTSVGSDLNIQWFIDSGISSAQGANIVRSAILSKFDRADEVILVATANGYLLPDNPISTLEKLNKTRRLFDPLNLTNQEDYIISQQCIELMKIVLAYDAGTITFNRSYPSAQLSSFNVSTDGMSPQSGDPLSDILGYQPDADFIKRKRALDSLNKLDFSKRKPYLLFTADVITDGKRKNGTILCWGKMRDASGYNITKRDVFSEIDFDKLNLANDDLVKTTNDLMSDNNFKQILSFYDWVHENDVFAFIDTSTHADTVYSYSISGFQNKAPASQFIFDEQMSALYLSPTQILNIQADIENELSNFNKSDTDSISPYPSIAKVIYGEPAYGWIIAGCNVLGSKRRGDSSSETRTLSYIGCKLSTVMKELASSRMFIPNDINKIHDIVASSISSYGVSQTILSILDGTGITMFTAGKDDPLGFQPTQESLENATGGLNKILSAIDPQSSTINPQTMLSTLSAHATAGSKFRYNAVPMSQQDSQVAIAVTNQPPSLIDVIGNTAIDLTTYEGISRLIQLIRSIYDFYPGALI